MGYLGTKPANVLATTEQIGDGAVQTADIANNAITRAKMGYAGAVLQVVNSLSNAGSIVTVANSGSGLVRGDILTATITPLSTSNRLLIIGNAAGEMISKSAFGACGILFEVNGTTYQIDSFSLYGGGTQFQPSYPAVMSNHYFVTAPSTSAITVKLRGYSYNESSGTNSIRFHNAILTVMEIAG